MGQKLTGTLDPTPVVGVTRKVNGFFQGTLLDTGNLRRLRRGQKFVYTFRVDDTDFPVQVRNPEGKYVDTDVEQNTKVSIFAPTVLHNALQRATVGMKLKIIYLGVAEKGSKGNPPHLFDVEVI